MSAFVASGLGISTRHAGDTFTCFVERCSLCLAAISVTQKWYLRSTNAHYRPSDAACWIKSLQTWLVNTTDARRIREN
jgi:hypothetical protein